MTGLRAQLSWLARGRANTVRTLDALSADLRALQEKVAALESRLVDLGLAQDALRERQLEEFDRVREAVAAAVDDLSTRIATLDERLGSRPGVRS